jgi:plastocyanin
MAAASRELDAFLGAVCVVGRPSLTRLGRGTVGLVALTLAFTNVAFWTVPATISNLVARSGFTAGAVPGAMAVLSTAGVLTAVAASTRWEGRGRAPAVVAGTAALVLGLVVALAGLRGSAAVAIGPDDLVVTADRTAFSESTLVVPAGTIAVVLDNHDYFWHTFTIRELDVDLRVPVGAVGRTTFHAAPGIYEFFCAIPGHDFAGMVGTLTVDER